MTQARQQPAGSKNQWAAKHLAGAYTPWQWELSRKTQENRKVEILQKLIWNVLLDNHMNGDALNPEPSEATLQPPKPHSL
jgi:hypothetical protein